MTRRASPQDWCAALQKTKGSFYHHFRDLDAYRAALLARWEEELTEAPIRAAMERVDQRRVDYLAELYWQGGHRRPRLLGELEYAAFVGAQQVGLFAAPARPARRMAR